MWFLCGTSAAELAVIAWFDRCLWHPQTEQGVHCCGFFFQLMCFSPLKSVLYFCGLIFYCILLSSKQQHTMSVNAFYVLTNEKQLVNSCSAIKKKTGWNLSPKSWQEKVDNVKYKFQSELGIDLTVWLNIDSCKVFREFVLLIRSDFQSGLFQV